MITEIGSEFWINKIPSGRQVEVPDWLSIFGNPILTTSGRGAISLLLEQVVPQFKTVLLPAFICDSVILPFIENGYSCDFYEINEDLSPNIESIKSYSDVGVFLHMGYFGYPTNSNLLSVLKHLKEHSTIIIEDVTHTLFSGLIRFQENDFYIGSIRKWFGVPTGGLVASSVFFLESSSLTNSNFSQLRTIALLNKGKYFETGDESKKDLYLNQISKAEILLDNDVNPYNIDNISLEIINSVDIVDLVSKRRENFNYLSKALKDNEYLEPLFNGLEASVCPMFYPVIIKNQRNEIRKKLTEEKIYCPIHWPIPEQIKDRNVDSTMDIYNTILSIPCDQRYGINEMERIVSVLKSL